jgi:hypothetical protein
VGEDLCVVCGAPIARGEGDVTANGPRCRACGVAAEVAAHESASAAAHAVELQKLTHPSRRQATRLNLVLLAISISLLVLWWTDVLPDFALDVALLLGGIQVVVAIRARSGRAAAVAAVGVGASVLTWIILIVAFGLFLIALPTLIDILRALTHVH